jgi:outer membrane lipopolysaccharide assembly protein LptE/RlpB
MTDPLKLFVIEYSITEGSVHVRTLRAMLENNRANLSRGLSSDYVPIGLVNSREEGDNFLIVFEQTLAPEYELQLQSRNWHHISEVAEQLLGELPPES